jgi:hypothetical protein
VASDTAAVSKTRTAEAPDATRHTSSPAESVSVAIRAATIPRAAGPMRQTRARHIATSKVEAMYQ